jgi:hypothetical protein
LIHPGTLTFPRKKVTLPGIELLEKSRGVALRYAETSGAVETMTGAPLRIEAVNPEGWVRVYPLALAPEIEYPEIVTDLLFPTAEFAKTALAETVLSVTVSPAITPTRVGVPAIVAVVVSL